MVPEEVFNKIRKLKEHKLNLVELESRKVVAGICSLCAISYCKFNVTPKNVLDKERDLLDKNTDGYLDIPSISQFICDDQEDDTDLLSRDLRGYIEIDESEK